MHTAYAWIVGVSLLLQGNEVVPARSEDPAHLREMLYDRRHPTQQSQAALLLVMNRSAEASAVVRQGLRQLEAPDVYDALTTAIRLCHDVRYNEELFEALSSGSAERRQATARTLGQLVDAQGLARLEKLARDENATLDVRRSAVWALGRSGRKSAFAFLIQQTSGKPEALRETAIAALTAMTGLDFAGDTLRWQAWWDGRKNLPEETWLAERLLYQASKARRLESELEHARAEVVRLHQQLYARLPAADRLSQIQAVIGNEDPVVRSLAVTWCTELIPGTDAVGQRAITELLLRLTDDSAVDVQRPAILALGRILEPRAFDRLRVLMGANRAEVRAAAARALTQQASLPRPEKPELTRQIQRQVVPALQKALEDPALEVVVEAAEDLGSLGLPEAAPVLTGLLKHPSEPVRQAAAQALERISDAAILGELLAALDDSSAAVRFSIIGAVGHAVGDGKALAVAERNKFLTRLEDLLARDTDPGVRSRAATVLGESAPPTMLPSLWKRVQAAEDSRVQDKAWSAFVNVIVRAASLELLTTWERTLVEAHQEARQLQLLSAAVEAWKKNNEAKTLIVPATEALIQAQLQQGKWAAAGPFIRELLAQPNADPELPRRLRWLLTAGELALKEGNKPEALRAVQDAQAFLPRAKSLAVEFEKLEKQAR
jgi:HEAT repeat protein